MALCTFTRKYDDFFGYRLVEGRMTVAGVADEPLMFEVRVAKPFAFGKGDTFSQTRWRF